MAFFLSLLRHWRIVPTEAPTVTQQLADNNHSGTEATLQRNLDMDSRPDGQDEDDDTTSTDTTVAHERKSYLFDPPTELRAIVYRFLVVDDWPKPIHFALMRKTSSKHHWHLTPGQPTIALTCHAIRNEVLGIYYAQNVFWQRRAWYRALGWQRWSRGLGAHAVHLRHLLLESTCGGPCLTLDGNGDVCVRWHGADGKEGDMRHRCDTCGSPPVYETNHGFLCCEGSSGQSSAVPELHEEQITAMQEVQNAIDESRNGRAFCQCYRPQIDGAAPAVFGGGQKLLEVAMRYSTSCDKKSISYEDVEERICKECGLTLLWWKDIWEQQMKLKQMKPKQTKPPKRSQRKKVARF